MQLLVPRLDDPKAKKADKQRMSDLLMTMRDDLVIDFFISKK